MCEILEVLGYKRIAAIFKTRETFLFNGVEICLDAINSKDSYLEFEVKVSDESKIPQAEELIRETASLIGLNQDDFIDSSYLELYFGENNPTKNGSDH